MGTNRPCRNPFMFFVWSTEQWLWHHFVLRLVVLISIHNIVTAISVDALPGKDGSHNGLIHVWGGQRSGFLFVQAGVSLRAACNRASNKRITKSALISRSRGAQSRQKDNSCSDILQTRKSNESIYSSAGTWGLLNFKHIILGIQC